MHDDDNVEEEEVEERKRWEGVGVWFVSCDNAQHITYSSWVTGVHDRAWDMDSQEDSIMKCSL